MNNSAPSDFLGIFNSKAVIPWVFDCKTKRFTFIGNQSDSLLGYSIEDWNNSAYMDSRRLPCSHHHGQGLYDHLEGCGEYFTLTEHLLRRNDSQVDLLITGTRSPTSLEDQRLTGIMLEIPPERRTLLVPGMHNRVLKNLARGITPRAAIEDLLTLLSESPLLLQCLVIMDETSDFETDVLTAKNLPREFKERILKLEIREEWRTPVYINPGIPVAEMVVLSRPGRPFTDDMKTTALDASLVIGALIEHQRIRQSLEQARSLLDSSNASTLDGILVVDSTGKIVSFNDRFLQLWRIPIEIVQSKDDSKAVNFVLDQLSDPDSFYRQVQFLYATPERESHDTLHFKDGRIFERYSRPHILNGKIVGRVWSFRDVTAQRHAERDLETTQRAKAQFIANISHEIRSPLSSIIGFVNLMFEPNQTSSDLLTWADKIRSNSEHLLSVVNEILDLSKTEFGKVEVAISEVELQPLFNDVVQSFLPRAQEKNISLTLETVGTIPTWIKTDRTKLRQILFNVIGNAIKYTESGGVNVRIQYTDTHTLKIEVQDTGIGISATDLDSIFKPFERTNTVLSRGYAGTGLGLALARNLARLLGGDVTLSCTKEGIGSQFLITIQAKPVLPPEALAQSSRKSPGPQTDLNSPQPLPPTHILVADDSADNRLLVSMVLKGLGAKVDFAEDGEEAVAKAQSRNYDMILMDIQMPKMDGHTATQRLRSLGYEAPIYALTAHALPNEVKKSFEKGCNGHLTKPINKSDLLNAILECQKSRPNLHTNVTNLQ